MLRNMIFLILNEKVFNLLNQNLLITLQYLSKKQQAIHNDTFTFP